MENTNGYYDFDLNEELGCGVAVDEVFYVKDLRQRKLIINQDIDQSAVADAVRHILQYNREDYGLPNEQRRPILLYVVSRGGEVDAGFELIDAIRISKTPVYTVNLGYQYSMAFLIGLAGHKRFATPNAKFLMHDGSQFVYDSAAKVRDQVEFQKRVSDRIRSYVLSRSRVSEEEFDSKQRVEWYMYADEAKEKGFVDCIIGEDCEIDEVV